MKHVNFFTYAFLAFSLLFFTGCDDDDDEPIVLDGSVLIGFSIPSKFTSDNRLQNEQVSHYVISVTDASGDEVLSKELITVDGQTFPYNSNDIPLAPGSYTITEFQVFSTNNALMYATPIDGSVMADSIDAPLPMNISITENNCDLHILEMIPVSMGTPTDYGYTFFGATDGEYEHFPVKIFSDEGEGANPLFNSSISISADGASHYTSSLIESSTEIYVKTGASAYSITVNHPDYESETVEVQSTETTNLQSDPLEITLLPNENAQRYREHFFVSASDSAYFSQSGDGSSDFTINVGVTNPAPFNRTFEIGVLADSTTAEDGVDYTLSSTSVTVAAYDTLGSVILTGNFDNLSKTEAERLMLTIDSTNNSDGLINRYDLYLQGYCPFVQSDFVGTAVATSTLFANTGTQVIEAGTEPNQIILKDFYSAGNDIVVTFDKVTATVSPTIGWVSGAYGDVTVEGTSTFNGCSSEKVLNLRLSHCVSVGCFPDDNITITMDPQ